MEQLSRNGFRHLVGIDYSEKAIQFCRAKCGQNPDIQFLVVDLLEEERQQHTILPDGQQFSVMIDKGTYDAICLMPDSDLALNRARYRDFLRRNLAPGGHLLIMSCNFTKVELLNCLLLNSSESSVDQSSSLKFEFVHEFDTPTLSFGGRQGRPVTGLVLRKGAL